MWRIILAQSSDSFYTDSKTRMIILFYYGNVVELRLIPVRREQEKE